MSQDLMLSRGMLHAGDSTTNPRARALKQLAYKKTCQGIMIGKYFKS